ncbi:hypothetical protein OTU49_005931, partial [Cherax quadricarinatus]
MTKKGGGNKVPKSTGGFAQRHANTDGGKVGKKGKGKKKGKGGLGGANQNEIKGLKNDKQNKNIGPQNEKQDKNVVSKKRNSKQESRKRKRQTEFTSEEVQMQLGDGLQAEHEVRASSRDLRTLYVRFPKSLKVSKGTEVKELVKEAIDVRLPRCSSINFCSHCFLEFESEEMTDRMKEKISKMKVGDESFYVDYVGKKSTYCRERQPGPVNPLKLYIGRVPMTTTRDDLRKAFRTAAQIDYRRKKKNLRTRFALITYGSQEEALKVFNSSKNLKINGEEVTVMFAKARQIDVRNNRNETPPKKMKMEQVVKEERK